jgi:hypothetical protein
MGILDNLLTPDTFDNLALGFNSMRLNPDQNLPDMIARRQALRREAGNRQKAIDYFNNIPGSEAYIGALNAGGSGANLISDYISTLEQRKRDELEHKRAIQRAAASRPAPSIVEMTTIGALQEAGLMPKGVVVPANMVNMPVTITKRNGQVVGIDPIQMPTPAKTSATEILTVQQLMESGAIGKGAAQRLAENPNALYEVKKENGVVTGIEPFTPQGNSNKTIQMLKDAAASGDTLAESALQQIEADPVNASFYYRQYTTNKGYKDRDANTVFQSKDLGNGLVQQTMKDNTVRYVQDGQVLSDTAEIQLAIDNADQAKVKQAREEAYAKAEGKYSGQEYSDINVAIRGVGERYAYSRDLITRMMNHPGMARATGSVAGLRGIGSYGEGSPEKEFITLYNQLAGQIFLGAFEGLKGGGQITELEGKTAQQAAANIDRQLDAPELRKALEQYLIDIFNQHDRLKVQRQNQKKNDDPSALEPLPTFEPDF